MADFDPTDDSRYSRQVRFAPLGEAGQRRLEESTALIVGCGALGSVSAATLVRAGVGRVRVVDRDFLELSNLQRQALFDEDDVARGLPKSIAATNKLKRINSTVTVEPFVTDVRHENIAELAESVDIIVDGTDNFETRLLLNDFAISTDTPWVYGGCLGAEGQVLAVLPGTTACLTCLVPEPPAPGVAPTCDTAGVLGPAVHLVASLQSIEAMKILARALEDVSRQLMVIDMWRNRWRQIDLTALHPAGSCPTCDERRFPWLNGERGTDADILCGRNAVQLRPATPTRVDLAALAARLETVGAVTSNPFLVRLAVEGYEITVFGDSRAIVSGTDDLSTARSVHARFIGS